MNNKRVVLVMILLFLAAYLIPFSAARVQSSLLEAFMLLQEYARKHVLFCLVPAFFIAGAITVFIRKEAVIKYLGPSANKVLSYGVASISGSILAVCSCTVLPLFAGIYSQGAGIGPATAFLYSGPAINVLAMVFTARVLGWELGLARTIGAVGFSIIIGLLMSAIFRRKQKKDGTEGDFAEGRGKTVGRPLWKTALYFGAMIGILIFINWSKGDASLTSWNAIYRAKWAISGILLAGLAWMLLKWFKKEELQEWALSTWIFARQIFPLLLAGVFVSGFLLGRPGHEGLIPSDWVARLVGGNSLGANLFASVTGALMYFATLTEVPILQGLIGSGMGKGPALALLLAGPALSLPSMIVLAKIMGPKKALTYILLVVGMATFTGLIFGGLVG